MACEDDEESIKKEAAVSELQTFQEPQFLFVKGFTPTAISKYRTFSCIDSNSSQICLCRIECVSKHNRLKGIE